MKIGQVVIECGELFEIYDCNARRRIERTP